MMRLMTGVVLAIMVPPLLVGCDGKAGSSAAGEKVAALPEGQRNAVFIRAIRDAGANCQGVEKSVRAGNYRDVPVWTATCSNGTNYTIVITPSGVAQILNEDELQIVDK